MQRSVAILVLGIGFCVVLKYQLSDVSVPVKCCTSQGCVVVIVQQINVCPMLEQTLSNVSATLPRRQ